MKNDIDITGWFDLRDALPGKLTLASLEQLKSIYLSGVLRGSTYMLVEILVHSPNKEHVKLKGAACALKAAIQQAKDSDP